MKKFFLVLSLLLIPGLILAEWSSDAHENTRVTDQTGEQALPKIVINENGESYVSWFSNESGNYNVRLQRFDARGNESWVHNGLLISDNPSMSWLTDYDLTLDRDSCAVITFQDIRAGDTDIYTYRISPGGVFLWGEDGLALSHNSDFEPSPKVVVTDYGNAVIAWQRATDTSVVVLQKVSPDGQLLWGAGIVLRTDSSEDYTWPFLLPLSGDQVLLIWYKETGVPMYPNKDIYAQKFDSSGNSVWDDDVPLYTGGGIPIYITPVLEGDGADGAYISWVDDRNNTSHLHAYVQHIDSSGSALMPENGVEVSTLPNRWRVQPTLSFLQETQELFAFWVEKNIVQSQFGLYGQKFTPTGDRLWTDYGKTFIELSTSEVFLIATKSCSDGVAVFFEDYSFGNVLDSKIMGMLLDSDGEYIWENEQVELSSFQSSKLHDEASDFVHNQWIVVWEDERNDGGDIYAQNIQITGELGPVLEPSITIVSPEDSTWIDSLPASIVFTVENFEPTRGDGFIAVLRNGVQIEEHHSLEPVLIDTLEDGENIITLRLMDNEGEPIIPLTEDSVRLYYHYIGIADRSMDTETPFILCGNYPNPFNLQTHITFYIPRASETELAIYDVSGQKVRTLISGTQTAGEHSIIWNGNDDDGHPVSSSIYFYRLKVDGEKTKTKSCLLLK